VSVKVWVAENNDVRVRFPARSWEHAHDVVEKLKEKPPIGYRLVESKVTPRGEHKSGRRCNVRLKFLHVDDRVSPMTETTGLMVFEPYFMEAQGV